MCQPIIHGTLERDTNLPRGELSKQEILAAHEEDSNETGTMLRKVYVVEKPSELLEGDALYFFCNRAYDRHTGKLTTIQTPKKRHKTAQQERKTKGYLPSSTPVYSNQS